MTDAKAPKPLRQNKKTGESWKPRLSGLVEVRGVEPLSENNSTGFSPGADGYCEGPDPSVPLPAGKPSRLQVR